MSAVDERVARGIALLDEQVPGWRERIDPDRLDMAAGGFTASEEGDCGCICAQLDEFGSYTHFSRRLFGISEDDLLLSGEQYARWHAWAFDHGFESALDISHHLDLKDDERTDEWDELTAAWKRALAGQP